MQTQKLVSKIQQSLTPDLLKGRWKGSKGVAGHCYIAAEAAYHMINGYKPYILTHKLWPEGLDEGETHWFLKNDKGEVLDPTKEQFSSPIPYHLGRGNGFLTKQPSRRAQVVIERCNSQWDIAVMRK